MITFALFITGALWFIALAGIPIAAFYEGR
jgi:hypothetical protein